MSVRPKLIILAGPTASGKTDVAIALATKLSLEIISADSMQVYKGMTVVSQAPPKSVVRKHSIRLVEFVDPKTEYSAARFRADAAKLISAAEKKGKTAVVTGGTGLYIRALVLGLFEEKDDSRDLKLRAKLLAEQEKHGGDWLHKKLLKVDPVSAAKIHPNDFRRIIRSLEVYQTTGKPISALKPKRGGLSATHDVRYFYLDRDRADLYDRINRRTAKMLKAGLIREVKRLSKMKLSQTASVALGLKEISAHLKGEATLEEALELLRRNTRHYAKRQLSWFRHEQGAEPIPVSPSETAPQIARKIADRLRT